MCLPWAQYAAHWTVAVNAFAIVVELNLKRRESDTKIEVLFGTMRDMMAALQR